MTDQFISYDFWLAFDYTGSPKGPVPRITKGEPQTERGVRAVRCTAKLPLSLFQTPSVSISIDVPYQRAPDVLANVTAAADAFKQTLGFDVDLQIHPTTVEAPQGDAQ